MKRNLWLFLLIEFVFSHVGYSQPSSWPASGDGSAGNPYTISNLENLRWIAENNGRWAHHYIQTNDIDATATGQGGDWGTEGWSPIGNFLTAFTGSYNGQDNSISGLFINRPATDLTGFFGNMRGQIRNLRIINADITGYNEVGILTGNCGDGGSLSGCFTSGDVNAEGDKVGGCIGWLMSGTSVINSGTSANVSKSNETNDIGGFVGYCIGNFLVSDCYAVGSVINTEPYYGGGFVGRINDNQMQGRVRRCFSSGYINNEFGGFAGDITGYPPIRCFWDIQTSQAGYSAGGSGKTTAEMKNIQTFTDLSNDAWDFIGNYYLDYGTYEIWNLDETTNSGYPFLSWQTHAWTGSQSVDWDDPDNWLSGSLPNSNSTVSISLATNNPQLYESSATCKNLIISSQNYLHVLGSQLTVSETLVNNGNENNLILEIEVGYNWGTIIHHTPGVPASFSHTINEAQWSTWDDGWHLLSSPTTGSPVSAWHTPGPGVPMEGDFYSWDEANNLWINRTSAGGILNPGFENDFLEGKGYLVAVKNSISEFFTGELNSVDVITPVFTKEKDGWNLAGNPFPCSIRWNDGNWNLTGFGGVAQVWKEQAKDYVELEANSIIPPCQGFMVYRTEESSQALTIPQASRTHELVDWYKHGNSKNRIVLIAHDSLGASYKRAVINTNPAASTAFDPEHDALLLSGFAPRFYSIAHDSRLSVNSLPAIDQETVIPLGFVKNNSNRFSIELAENIEGFQILLVDTKTGKEHHFSNGRYYFSSEESDPPNRFFIKFLRVGVCEIPDRKTMAVWTYDNILYVNQKNDNFQLEIFDIHGQCVQSSTLSGSGVKQLSLSSFSRGIYLIRLTNEQGTMIKKIQI